MTPCNIVLLAVDASRSMLAPVHGQVFQGDGASSGFVSLVNAACRRVPGSEARSKLCVALASLAAVVDYVAGDEASLARAARRMIAVSTVSAGDPPVLAAPPRPLAEVAEAYRRLAGGAPGPREAVDAAMEALGLDPGALAEKAASSSYTDAAHIEAGVREAVEAARGRCTPRGGRLLVVCFSDCCLNAYRGRRLGLGEVPGALRVARQEAEAAAAEAGLSGYGVACLMAGDWRRLEVDMGICPLRAALIASTMADLDAAFPPVAAALRDRRLFAADPTWASVRAEQGLTVEEYAVRRLRDPEGLARLLIEATTSTSSVAGGGW